jgi:cell division protein ZapA
VNITIAGRSYALTCRDGDEPRLHQLSRMIAERVDKVKSGSPGLTEVRQFLFASLLLADELSDAQAEVKRGRQEVQVQPADDSAAVHAIEQLAERLESIGHALAVGTPAP